MLVIVQERAYTKSHTERGPSDLPLSTQARCDEVMRKGQYETCHICPDCSVVAVYMQMTYRVRAVTCHLPCSTSATKLASAFTSPGIAARVAARGRHLVPVGLRAVHSKQLSKGKQLQLCWQPHTCDFTRCNECMEVCVRVRTGAWEA